MASMQSSRTYSYINEVAYKTINTWSVTAILSNKSFYRDEYELVHIGSLLAKNREKEIIKDDRLYKQVTIRLYGKGVVQRGDELVLGKTIGTKNQFRISEGQFIMSKIDARNGAFGIVPEDLDGAITTQDFLSYSINTSKIIPEFFVLITGTKHFAELCQKASSGTTGRQRVDERTFLSFRVPIPPLDEQKAIIAKDKATKEKIHRAGLLITKLSQEVNQFLSRELGLATSALVNHEEKFQIINYSEISEWGIDSPSARVRNLFSKLKFKSLPISTLCRIGSGGTPSRSRKDFYEGNIPWIKTGEIRENVITETEEKITEKGLLNSSAKIYPKGSLIVAMYGATAGRSAMLGIDAATNQACAILYNINEEIVRTDFLWIYLQSQIENFKLLASGSAQPNLNSIKVANYLVPIPDLKKQKEIVTEIKKLQSSIQKLKAEEYGSTVEQVENFESVLFNK